MWCWLLAAELLMAVMPHRVERERTVLANMLLLGRMDYTTAIGHDRPATLRDSHAVPAPCTHLEFLHSANPQPASPCLLVTDAYGHPVAALYALPLHTLRLPCGPKPAAKPRASTTTPEPHSSTSSPPQISPCTTATLGSVMIPHRANPKGRFNPSGTTRERTSQTLPEPTKQSALGPHQGPDDDHERPKPQAPPRPDPRPKRPQDEAQYEACVS